MTTTETPQHLLTGPQQLLFAVALVAYALALYVSLVLLVSPLLDRWRRR